MQVRLHSRRFLAGFRPTPWDGLAFALIFGLLLLFSHGVREAWQPLTILQAERWEVWLRDEQLARWDYAPR